MMTDRNQQRLLDQFLVDSNMSIEERFPGCGFVYYDEYEEQRESGSVYWNLEEDSNGKTVLRLAVQHGRPSPATMSRIQEALHLWMNLS
jgi:hypothetical protein